ncbi:MAG: hypothetical protein GXO55_08375 [Chloroflexi bacterium]|nr:hypothetical protein [Chloroflexota bacterium]
MDAREIILARLRAQQRDEPHPPAWRSRRHFPDLIARFGQALEEVGGEFLRVANWEGAWEALGKVLDDVGAKRVVVNPDPPLDRFDVAARWPTVEWHVVGRDGDVRSFAREADVGVSSAVAALAETGTVIVASGPAHSRLAVLLPPVHVVLLPASRVTVDLFTWVAQWRGASSPLPSSVTLITGPSKTADIEQTLATGVHGPGRLIVVLVEEGGE